MESVEREQITELVRLPTEIGSKRFSWKEAIKWGVIAGVFGLAAGFSLVAASAQFYDINLYSLLIEPLTIGLGFGGLGFVGGGILGRLQSGTIR
ncbi:hypothetical protein A3F00_03825 [Candidatus Daviesbacteria bacterium RIFCSPHIGHO2_12_FULL_37_11]|uniref:Uncharacterized protein n=1 Tax=Candidatus Daviesbacteria bacterium RIFCSPHIGHO2_12_FULL_37_11 TaxID=1797777 RepID=A0A1F5KBE1_9BACT|nr:MAG: hypothetical protein A2111_02650 [Candidatus Daviesbacteria bacterium GWA1_38_6]OGE38209.1 MAG: hypothetical protein A3F00_03825 [Candidatus Daviesbacteria bacterium RIFCSPHIGHO2_12_FULL_37_11]OGE45881.1 MAG: hypothetical protein A3B39_01610 [Candidatus Daviesbacteria bacterium RIFCSPLOWO2_01_FULL_37_10]